MTTYLVDNSIWQKATRSTAISSRLEQIYGRDLIITCPPQVLEYCHSARSRAEYVTLRAAMDALLPAMAQPTSAEVLDIQQALWGANLVRAAGASDCLIAAYAFVNGAVILNSDPDFRYIEAATAGAVRQEYVSA